MIVFVVIGRRSHDEGSALAGIVSTAAPFLIATLIGGLAVAAAARRSGAAHTTLRAGAAVWIGTVVVGMLLRRAVFDRGTAASFVIVAAVALGVSMLGWRVARRAIIGRWIP